MPSYAWLSSPSRRRTDSQIKAAKSSSQKAIEDSYERLMNPSIQTEVRQELKDRSDQEAIKVFRENLGAH